MGIFRRKQHARKHYTPSEPEPLDESIMDSATQELAAVTDRDEEIEETRARLLKIHRDNALGPRFWAAVGERRA